MAEQVAAIYIHWVLPDVFHFLFLAESFLTNWCYTSSYAVWLFSMSMCFFATILESFRHKYKHGTSLVVQW